jgi:lipoprotein LprG
MPTRRRLSAVFAALCATAALVAGCSSSSTKSSKPLPDAATLLKQSSQATKNVKSVHLTLSVTGTIKQLPVKMLTGDLTTDPSTAAKGSATITFLGSDVDTQFVVYDTTLYAAITPDKWSDFGPAAKVYDPSSILNPDTGLANILANFTDAKSEGRETVDGQDTVRVTGKVSAEALNKLASQLKATEAQPATVWIEENGDHELVQVKLEQGSGTIGMTLSDWNKPVQVTKPPVSG